MRSRGSRITLIVMAALALVALAATGVATATGSKPERLRATLNPVPHDPAADGGSNVTGRVKLQRRGNTLRVQLKVRGVSPGLAHAIHIHGKDAPELAKCPGAERRDDLVNDGLIETVEGIDDYGPIRISFTKTGDTSPASGLALDRFPVGKQNGKLTYKRTFRIPSSEASRLEDLHIVVHGDDINHNGHYEGRITALGAPLEAELPVACGEIHRR